MNKNPIKDRFIIASHKSSIQRLTKTITLAFYFFLGAIQHMHEKCRFSTCANTFLIIQCNKVIIDVMNKLNKLRAETSISSPNFPILN